MKLLKTPYQIDAYHDGCGRYGSDLIEEDDGSLWEICTKCGEEIREVKN